VTCEKQNLNWLDQEYELYNVKCAVCVCVCVRVGVLYAVNRSYVDTASVRLWVVTLMSSIE